MKKKLCIIILIGIFFTFFIYQKNKNTDIYFITLGDGLSSGMTPYNVEGYNYNDYVRDYLESEHKLEEFISAFSQENQTVENLITKIEDNYKLEEKNITILISSHILSELYAVATRFCIIENGRVIKELSKEELDIECSKCVVIQTDNIKKAAIILEKELKTTNYKVIDKKEIRLYEYLDQISKISKALTKNDISILGLYETGITLEEYFKSVIKEAN